MKPNFKKLEIEDLMLWKKLNQNSNCMDSENAFGTHFLWSKFLCSEIYFYENVAFIRLNQPNLAYKMPFGVTERGEMLRCIKLLIENAKSQSKPFKLTDLNKAQVEILKSIMPNKFSFTSEREKFEYIYQTKDLAELSGKKYHSKRNHISKFNKLYKWHYEELTENNLPECAIFLENWFTSHNNDKLSYNEHEYVAIKKTINHYSKLNFFGGLLKIDNKIIACTIAEKINHRTITVHFEKANPEFEGVYAVINNEFCKEMAKDFKFINREEDLGIEGLRKAKLSYHPCALLERFTAVLKE